MEKERKRRERKEDGGDQEKGGRGKRVEMQERGRRDGGEALLGTLLGPPILLTLLATNKFHFRISEHLSSGTCPPSLN